MMGGYKVKNSLNIALIFVFLLTTGCQAVNVDDTTVPIGFGFEWEDTDEFKVTAQLAKPRQAGEGSESEAADEKSFIVVSKTGETLSMASRNLSLILPRLPLWTFASLLVIGENLAARDAALYSDVLARVPRIRTNIMVVVCQDTSPEKLLQIETPLEPLSAIGITKIIEIQKEQLGIYVPITIGEFISKLATPGLDPVVPIARTAKTGDKEQIKIEGTAIFSGAKMVGSFNERESRGYRWTIPKVQQGGLITIPDPTDAGKIVVLELIRTEAKSKPFIDGKGNISVNISIKAEGNFYEQHSGHELINLKGFTAMEKLAAQEIEKEVALAIKRSQELNSDIFGWGQLIYNKHPQVWHEIEADWYDYYPFVNSNIEVTFELRRSYLTNKTFKFR